MKHPEPAVVTIAKMDERQAVRVSEAEQALAAACAEVTRQAQAVEGGDATALRRLAAAEKRRDKLAAELDRLRQFSLELAAHPVQHHQFTEPVERQKLESDTDAVKRKVAR